MIMIKRAKDGFNPTDLFMLTENWFNMGRNYTLTGSISLNTHK